MPPKKTGYEFWNSDLRGAQYILAPMVDQSELAWRLLSRQYGAHLCYTPMIHASVFIRDARYRKEIFSSCKEDRPLIVQFCANDPEILLQAARLVSGQCEAVDLNLGCPQTIAKKGHYGAYLQDDWDLIWKMVNQVNRELDVPITCKIRIFESVEKTVKYAQMLESAGCQLLSVHGRTREQKGPLTSFASWAHIKAVKENVSIPVFANGNIQYLDDVTQCLKETGVDGVMIAEGSLHNPALFKGLSPPVWQMAEEYLKIIEDHPCPLSYIRGHLFKLFHHLLSLEENSDLQQDLAKANSTAAFLQVTNKLKFRFSILQNRNEIGLGANEELSKLPFPPWICQPYVRPCPSTTAATRRSDEDDTNGNETPSTESKKPNKRHIMEGDSGLSRKKLKKLRRNPRKCFNGTRKYEYERCAICQNPKGSKCSYDMCRKCCKNKCHTESLPCSGHRVQVRPVTLEKPSTRNTQPIHNINCVLNEIDVR